MEKVNCDLCGSSLNIVLWDKTERKKAGKLNSAVITKDGKIIQGTNRICKSCGLVFISPRMSKEELDEFYKNEYRAIYKRNDTQIAAEKNHADTAWSYIDMKVPIEFKDRKVNSLDIGCGTGELVEKCAGTFNAYGIEPTTAQYELAKEKGLNVESCTLEDYNPPFKFDIVTMLNVLEHVLSPTEVLNKIHSMLNDNGYLLVSVPNLYNRSIMLPVDAFLSNCHLYNFSIDTLRAYYLKTGFKIVKAFEKTEEMGDKIYLLGQKMDKKQEYIPTISPDVVEMTKFSLERADEWWKAKYMYGQLGFK